MTVITKPISENKVEKPLEKPLVVSVGAGGLECVETGYEGLSVDARHAAGAPPEEEELWSWSSNSARRRRVSATTTVCVFVATLVLLTGAIIGGVYVHRQFTHNKVSRFRGWCGVPFNHSRLGVLAQPMHHQPSSAHWPLDADGIFNQRFDLDLGTDSHEYIHVPDFGLGKDGEFIHDYKNNLTAIIDESTKRCFVFPLDHGLVSTPQATFYIIRRMQHGFYDGDMTVIRETLRVVRPPLQDLSDQGPYIGNFCRDYTTYRLEKRTHVRNYRLKRSADDQEPTPFMQTPQHFTVAEFTGKAIVEYTVIDD
ncbi:BRICHOS domain [Trinorchestia longiramus]|nr:BRICHOS domain [Trinorchestia longiramus]